LFFFIDKFIICLIILVVSSHFFKKELKKMKCKDCQFSKFEEWSHTQYSCSKQPGLRHGDDGCNIVDTVKRAYEYNDDEDTIEDTVVYVNNTTGLSSW
jgi:hypothetical protein